MALADDLKADVKNIFATDWATRKGQVVPDSDSVKLGNDAVELDATVLYADLAESTDLVDKFKWGFAAEVYKSYLICAAKIIRSHGGVITAFDGDRIMAVYIGDGKNTSAARTALKINKAVQDIINPEIKSQYPTIDYVVKQSVGVDTGTLHVAKTGIRGSNDLVWVGRPANYAAKLCALRNGNYASWITAEVYKNLSSDMKTYDGKDMWEERSWTAKGGISIYRSSWTWPV